MRKFVSSVLLAVVVAGLIINFQDIKRYIRISTM
jgi:uncharacterized protein DUF6893